MFLACRAQLTEPGRRLDHQFEVCNFLAVGLFADLILSKPLFRLFGLYRIVLSFTFFYIYLQQQNSPVTDSSQKHSLR